MIAGNRRAGTLVVGLVVVLLLLFCCSYPSLSRLVLTGKQDIQSRKNQLSVSIPQITARTNAMVAS